MRRCVPMCLVLLAIGCKSPEEKACETTVKIIEAAAAEHGREDGKSTTEHQRGCLNSLSRLRQEIKPDEDTWYTYLRCLRVATDMGDQAECLTPLTATQTQQIQTQSGRAAGS